MEEVSFHKLFAIYFYSDDPCGEAAVILGYLCLLVVQDRTMTSWRLEIGQILAGYMFILLHTPLSFLSCCVGLK